MMVFVEHSCVGCPETLPKAPANIAKQATLDSKFQKQNPDEKKN